MQANRGSSHPLGATVDSVGVNFSVFSEHAEAVELLLFDSAHADEPAAVFALDRAVHHSSHYWHVHVPDIGAGQVYAWRAHGPSAPADGHRFQSDAILLDPYGRAIANTTNYVRPLGAGQARGRHALKSIVVDDHDYDWGDDQPLERPFAQTVIYEMHLAGFTRHPSSGLAEEVRGTYRGLIEKIDYLKDLGVTAVELLPVFHFDPFDAPPGRMNYWGYAPISFFAPHAAYSSAGGGQAAIDEFRDMVRALHSAGIEVILDVVYNHTAEGDARGPTQSFRGLDNATYYILEQGEYANFSGCGNTVNANAAVVRRLILDSLRYWVEVMHVDGFRFDLASILSRAPDGEPMANPPLLWDIETDPVLAGTKLIAEAWDAAGLYQVGDFFGHHYKEWNGRFRDDVRAFFRGDHDSVRNVAQRIVGSPDIYGHRVGAPERSVNFVTAHDGFTLNDVVSYERKHNEANGEDNRDGENHNTSWNCGVEGPSDDPAVQQRRVQDIKNMLTLTLVSLGAPMLLCGDEIRRTQRGNNNAYCQDNEISWFDWSTVDQHAGLRRFVRELIKLRNSLAMHQPSPGRTLASLLATAELLRWHGVKLDAPDWASHSHSIAMQTRGPSGHFFLILNAYHEPLTFELPDEAWRHLVDTSRPSPNDYHDFELAPHVQNALVVPQHSVQLLAAGVN